MRVKRFVANDVQEAMAKVKAELGDEAVILHVRQVREGGILGFFGRMMTEVTAAVEEKKATTHISAEVGEKPAYSEEMREMRKVMEQMSQKINDLGSTPKAKGLSKLHRDLIDKELDETVVKRLVKKVEKLGARAGTAEIHNLLTQELTNSFKDVAPIVPMGKKPLVAALVGPTGVGKTTTIAKLAANFSLIEKQKVTLVTADTYRVAAVDQLKTFAEIIRAPVEVVVSPNSAIEAIQRHQDKDLILIDTAGRSPNNQIQMSELRAFLEKAQPDRVFLTISATTRVKDMLDIVEKFDFPCIDSLIFTKLDETSTYGGIVSVLNKTKKPLAYLTNGQSVPDDIILANPQYVVRHILGGVE